MNSTVHCGLSTNRKAAVAEAHSVASPSETVGDVNWKDGFGGRGQQFLNSRTERIMSVHKPYVCLDVWVDEFYIILFSKVAAWRSVLYKSAGILLTGQQ